MLPRIKLPARVIAAALSLATACGQVIADNQRDVVIAPDGTEIIRVMSGDRRMPHSTIAVCSDGGFDDVKNLKVVARVVLPEETYTIVDARSLPEDVDKSSITLVYFGAPLSKIGSNECLDRFPKLKQFVADEAREIQLRNDERDQMLRKQFRTQERVLGAVVCSDATYPKYQLESKKEIVFMYRDLESSPLDTRCEMNYLWVFGFYEIGLKDIIDSDVIRFILKRFAK